MRHEQATFLYGGGRTPIGPNGLTIGPPPDNDVVIAKPGVSRHHARIAVNGSGHEVVDLGSKNGTLLNGERLNGAAQRVINGDTVHVGGEPLRFVTGQETAYGAQRPAVLTTQAVPLPHDRLTIGRDPANAVVLDDPNVSPFHAEVVRDGERIVVRDLGSRNGTRVDGRVTRRAVLGAGAAIGIGPYRVVFDGTGFVAKPERGALRLDADAVTIQVKGKRILNAASLVIEPGEFVAIIGESGSGKSTFIKALAGVTRPASGAV